jgi:hypothetical protein
MLSAAQLVVCAGQNYAQRLSSCARTRSNTRMQRSVTMPSHGSFLKLDTTDSGGKHDKAEAVPHKPLLSATRQAIEMAISTCSITLPFPGKQP